MSKPLFPDSLSVVEAAIEAIDAGRVVPSHVQSLKPFDRFLGLVHQAPGSADPAAVLNEAAKAVAPLAVAVAAASKILDQARAALLPDPVEQETDDDDSGLARTAGDATAGFREDLEPEGVGTGPDPA